MGPVGPFWSWKEHHVKKKMKKTHTDIDIVMVDAGKTSRLDSLFFGETRSLRLPVARSCSSAQPLQRCFLNVNRLAGSSVGLEAMQNWDRFMAVLWQHQSTAQNKD